jgi:hypothetical protein
VATGSVSLADTPDYASQGPATVFDVTSEVPTPIGSECYVLAFPFATTCTDDQIEALLNGTAVVENNIVVSPAGIPAGASP